VLSEPGTKMLEDLQEYPAVCFWGCGAQHPCPTECDAVTEPQKSGGSDEEGADEQDQP